jgi:hypothetical protein
VARSIVLSSLASTSCREKAAKKEGEMNEAAFVYITMYLIANHQGDPLFCDRGQGLTYNIDSDPWVALPLPGYGKEWFCGDEVTIWSDGEMRTFLALDSWLHGSCIKTEEGCIPIGADVPEPFAWWRGLSTRAIIVNRDEAKRRLTIEQ